MWMLQSQTQFWFALDVIGDDGAKVLFGVSIGLVVGTPIIISMIASRFMGGFEDDDDAKRNSEAIALTSSASLA